MNSEVVNVSLRDALYAGDWQTVAKYIEKCRDDEGPVEKEENTSGTAEGPSQTAMKLCVTHRISESINDNMINNNR